jgi:osmotically inducible protein OsmC
LIAAAHAGCFTMALSAQLSQAGFVPDDISTVAKVHLSKDEIGLVIPSIELETSAKIPGIDDAKFQELAAAAKKNCPVSRALAGPSITLAAKLVP